MNLPEFIPGLTLAEIFFRVAVQPILHNHFPDLLYSAARLDYGSDVLGFDTPQSRDHGWGPKVTLFLSPSEFDQQNAAISNAMAAELPPEISGYPTNYDEPFSGEAQMVPVETGPVKHWVAVTTIPNFFSDYLGVDPMEEISIPDWLTMPPQHLRTVAAGRVFRDGLDRLEKARTKLSWHPHDIWLYLLSNGWRRIDQEEPFMARCGDVGDQLGSRLVAARLIQEIMKLCFLMERQFPPYNKWFGMAFSRLDCASELTPIFHRIFNAQTWQEREQQLSAAYLNLMERQNALDLMEPIEPKISSFYNRPYQVPWSGRFAEALQGAIQSEAVKKLPPNLGGLSQFVDSTDILADISQTKQFRTVFKPKPDTH
jgi:hypothetical protein